MPAPAPEIILNFNRGREPERLAMKFANMNRDPFVFLRGTCHLFYQRLAELKLSTGGPPTWICGDLHLENFGTYLGENGLTYFDVNDFDEACLAPATWDILRLATSVLVAAPSLGLADADADQLALDLIERWRQELTNGKPRWIERKTATGLIGDLMDELKRRKPGKFLDKRTVLKKDKRKLVIDGVKTLAISDDDRDELAEFTKGIPTTAQEQRFFKFRDAARRIAGTGSLGIARYVLLIEGSGSPDGNVLLDLKKSVPSAVAPRSPCAQPAWPDEAHRIAAIIQRCQVVPVELLRPVVFRGDDYLLRELQPTADRINLQEAAGDTQAFSQAVHSMGMLAAGGHLRGAGRDGSAAADALIAFARDSNITQTVLNAARRMADVTRADFAEYRAAYDAGKISVGKKPQPAPGLSEL